MGVCLQENFLTRQTKADVLSACNAVLLGLKHHRLAAEAGLAWRFFANFLSSRACEYIFQALRSGTRTSSKFTRPRRCAAAAHPRCTAGA